mgnify:CR=1 FL=1
MPTRIMHGRFRVKSRLTSKYHLVLMLLKLCSDEIEKTRINASYSMAWCAMSALVNDEPLKLLMALNVV